MKLDEAREGAAAKAEAWDTASHANFYSYYEQQSLSEKTMERFRLITEALLRLLESRQEARTPDVLDAGRGAGAQSKFWLERGHRYRGIDISRPLTALSMVQHHDVLPYLPALKSLARFLSRARKAVRLRGEVDLLITTDAEVRALNRAFRKKDQPTDVLSFPALGLNGHAGDIAISAPTAARQAKHLGHALNEELKVLTLHGVLHLAGHDHESDDGKMQRLEKRLRSQLGLSAGLIERSVGAVSAPKKRGRA